MHRLNSKDTIFKFVRFVGVILIFVLCSTTCEENGPATPADIESIRCGVVPFSDKAAVCSDTTEQSLPREMFAINVWAMVVSDRSGLEDGENPSYLDDNPLIHPVVDIRIETINDYSAEYPAGSVVNKAFGIVGRFGMYAPIPWPEKGDASAFITHVTSGESVISFAVRELPDVGKHQFKVVYVLDDGRVLSALTREVILN